MQTPEEMFDALRVMAGKNVRINDSLPNYDQGCVIMCNVYHGPDDDPVSGATVEECCDCHQKIWCSPSSKRLVEKHKEGKLKCITCVAENDAKQEGFEVGTLLPSQALELAMETDITSQELKELQNARTYQSALFRLIGSCHRGPRHDD